jgi:hypothetical protein
MTVNHAQSKLLDVPLVERTAIQLKAFMPSGGPHAGSPPAI